MSNCKEQLFRNYSYYPCSRKPWKDGYCKQHHPETVAARATQREARWKAQDEVWRKERRLERAAPDLLEACNRCLDFINIHHTGTMLREMLEAAIAKAEGKP